MEAEEAGKELLKRLKPGSKVFLILRHVARSGMFRTIDPLIFVEGRPFYLQGKVAAILDWKISRKYEGLEVHGCGMDMGFYLVYNLGRKLYPDGFKDKDGKHQDGGYALEHCWL